MRVKNIYKIFSISVIFVALIISIIAMSTYSLDEELEDSFTGALLIEDKDAIPFVESTKGVDISSFPSSFYLLMQPEKCLGDTANLVNQSLFYCHFSYKNCSQIFYHHSLSQHHSFQPAFYNSGMCFHKFKNPVLN